MFDPYGDESPEELRAIQQVNVVMAVSFALFVALFLGVMVFGVGRVEKRECRIPEICASESP